MSHIAFIRFSPAGMRCSYSNEVKFFKRVRGGRPISLEILDRRTLLHTSAGMMKRRARQSQRTTAITAVTSVLTAELADYNSTGLIITGTVFALTAWGVVSFVKGSVKDRITQAQYRTLDEPEEVMKRVVSHFSSRSFTINREADSRPGVITFEGTVRASYLVAAILLSCGASVLWGIAVMIDLLLPPSSRADWYFWLPLLSLFIVPYYWNGATRKEQFKVKLEENELDQSRVIYVKGHRDEVAEFQNKMRFAERK
mmetsp:Transcript_606/g.1203  ORF Transcript_606/g.1203 Transcript_606/m.1203 type:complete len:256 (-) Transcript_606:693-1460(-)